MADELISRQAVLAHSTLIPGFVGEYVRVDRIKDAPTVDAVEVVRCKDCKKNPRFSKTSGKHMVWCRKWRCEVKDTDFCSYGERREEND